MSGRSIQEAVDSAGTEIGAFVTLPDLMQPVHTLTRLTVPSTRARTRWMFGFQRRLVRRCECDTDMPHEGFLPHTSHTEAMGIHRSSLRGTSGVRERDEQGHQASDKAPEQPHHPASPDGVIPVARDLPLVWPGADA